MFILDINLVDTICFQYYNSINGEVKAQSPFISLIRDHDHLSTINNLTRPISIKIYGKI